MRHYETLLSHAPKAFGKRFQYYYRRGAKFFFRSDNGKRFHIIALNADNLNETRSHIEFGKWYQRK